MQTELALRMKGISKSFPGVQALQDVSFEVKKGEVHALLGENGAGKSTLLKILSGAYERDEGDIWINGSKIGKITPKSAQELGISIIYQEFSSLPFLSVAENIFLGQLPKKGGLVDWKECYKKSRYFLEQVGLDIDPSVTVSELKVAQQQMVEIAKAISKDAKIIIMDEPTAPLTEREIESLFKVILELKEKGVSIIYVSHRLVEIHQVCDRLTVLRDGCNAGKSDVSSCSVNEIIRMMVGRDLKDLYPRSEAKVGDVVLQVNHLSTYEKLNDISFQARAGEILGIAGLVGAGRTELARAIFGADPISDGEVLLNDDLIKISSPSDSIGHRIGLVPEDRKGQGLVLMMTVKDNITLANLKQIRSKLGLRLGKEEKVAVDYVNKLNIVTPSVYEEVSNLSGGNQQKVVLSKWLYYQCKVLIIDEPTRGIDVGAKVEIYQLINELVKQGTCVIMISSELPELMGVCNRILVMHEGCLAGTLEKDEFDEELIMQYATGQHKAING